MFHVLITNLTIQCYIKTHCPRRCKSENPAEPQQTDSLDRKLHLIKQFVPSFPLMTLIMIRLLKIVYLWLHAAWSQFKEIARASRVFGPSARSLHARACTSLTMLRKICAPQAKAQFHLSYRLNACAD